MIQILQNLPYKTYIGLFLCSLFAGYWLYPRLTWLIASLGFPRSTNTRTNATEGPAGLAIGVPFLAGLALLLLLRNQVSSSMYMIPYQMRGIFFGSLAALALGTLHDLFRLHRYLRIVLQIAIAGYAFHHGFRFDDSPGYGFAEFQIVDFSISILWIVCVISLFDLTEKMSRGRLLHYSVIPVLALLVSAFVFDKYRTIVICCGLLGPLLAVSTQRDGGYRPALGSSGAYVLGFALSAATMQSALLFDWHALVVAGLLPVLAVLLLIAKPRLQVLLFPKPQSEGASEFRAQFHLKEAALIRFASATCAEELWRQLCKAADDLGYTGPRHRSSLGESLEVPGLTTGDSSPREFVLPRSGGFIRVGEGSGTRSPVLFQELIDEYDRKLDELNRNCVASRRQSTRVLFINRHYSGNSATGQILEDIANDFVRSDIAVSVLTGSVNYGNSTQIAGSNEIVDAIHIKRVGATFFGHHRYLNRAADMCFFYLYACCLLLGTRKSRYTHVIAFTDPPLISVLGLIASRMKSWRFLYVVQDLYPEIAQSLGVLQSRLLGRLFSLANRRTVAEADAVVAVSPSMANRLRLISCQARISVIRNWTDGEYIRPKGRDREALRTHLGIKDSLAVAYAGNIGPAQLIEEVLNLIEALKDHSVQFLFFGAGTRKNTLSREIRERSLHNARVLDYVPRRELGALISACDVGLAALSPSLEGLALPTKTYCYLAAGVPVFALAKRGPDWDFIEEENLGLIFHPDELDKMIHYLSTHSGGLPPIFDSSLIRKYFERHLDRALQTRLYRGLVEDHSSTSNP